MKILAILLVIALIQQHARSSSTEKLSNKTFMLFAGSPFGFWGGPYNKTRLDEFLEGLEKISDLVDVVSIPSYFLEDPANKTSGGLKAEPNGDIVNRAVQDAGFRVVPLIGDFYGQNDIRRYRYCMSEGRDEFIQACMKETRRLSLDGLNFDFEPSPTSCENYNCSEDDARVFAEFLTMVETNLSSLGAHAQVDTGQSVLAKTSILNQSRVSRLITMNTYYDTASYDIALPRDLHNDGLDRFSLGICPGCFNSSLQDVKHRVSLAQTYNVRHIAYWSESNIPDVWLSDIRDWKLSKLK